MQRATATSVASPPNSRDKWDYRMRYGELRAMIRPHQSFNSSRAENEKARQITKQATAAPCCLNSPHRRLHTTTNSSNISSIHRRLHNKSSWQLSQPIAITPRPALRQLRRHRRQVKCCLLFMEEMKLDLIADTPSARLNRTELSRCYTFNSLSRCFIKCRRLVNLEANNKAQHTLCWIVAPQKKPVLS